MTHQNPEEPNQNTNNIDPSVKIQAYASWSFEELCEIILDDPEPYDGEREEEKMEESPNIQIPEAKPQPVGKPQKKKRNRKKSAYHNFQKHLVTTVRRHLKSKILKKRGDAHPVALEMWALFMKEKVYTKQFLLLIIGHYQEQSKAKFIEMLKKYKIFPIYDKYETNQFQSAQNYLKQRVIEVLNNLQDRKILYKRRIKMDMEFVNYLREFSANLERDKRLKVIVQYHEESVIRAAQKIQSPVRETSAREISAYQQFMIYE